MAANDALVLDTNVVLDWLLFCDERVAALAGAIESGAVRWLCCGPMRAEFERSRTWVLRLKGADELLQGDQRLAASIRLRNPYIDPMSLLQVDLLKRWRADDRQDDALLQALVACVNGVAQGLQNTG